MPSNTGKFFLNAVESFDPILGVWRIETQMPTKRSGLAAVVMNERIYCLGGYDGKNFVSTIESFDPRTGEWQVIIPAPHGIQRFFSKQPLERLLRHHAFKIK